MRTATLAFAIALLASFLLTPLVRWLAHRLDLLDHALTSRKIHGRPVPRLGGVAIVGGFYAPLAALAIARAGEARFLFTEAHRTVGLLAGGGAMALVGLLDDVRGLHARTKLVAQVAAALFAWWMGFRIETLVDHFGPVLHLGRWGLPLTVLWIVGVTNALNLVDGLDGLAGGVALSAVVVTFAGSIMQGDPLMALFAACLAGGIAGFLRYNFHPASIFMGDCGSMFLGYVLATTSIVANAKSSAAVALAVPAVALGLPIADTLLAMGRRWLRGSPVFLADREHIHHRLLALGLSQRQVALVLYGVCVLLAAAALALGATSGLRAAAVLGSVTGLAVLAVRRLGFLRLHKLAPVLALRRRNLVLRERMGGVEAFLHTAQDMEEVWSAVKLAEQVLGAASVALRFSHGHEGGRPHLQRYAWRRLDANGLELHCTRHSLLVERPGDRLELGWRPEQVLDRDTEIAVEQLCALVQDAVQRLERANPAGRELVDAGAAKRLPVVPASELAPACGQRRRT